MAEGRKRPDPHPGYGQRLMAEVAASRATMTTRSRAAAETGTSKKSRKRKRREVCVKTSEIDAHSLFVFVDFFPRYYQTHPQPPKNKTVPYEILDQAAEEWWAFSDTEKAKWSERLKDLYAHGRTLYTLRHEVYPLYPNI